MTDDVTSSRSPTPPSATVAVVVDQPMLLEHLVALLTANGYRVSARGRNVEEVANALASNPPDAIVGDGRDPIALAGRLRALSADARLLVFASEAAQGVAPSGTAAPVHAWLPRTRVGGRELLAALSAVLQGQLWRIEAETALASLPSSTATLHPVLRALSQREREVLGLLADGLDNAAIASRLGITERTVKAHVSSLYRALGSEHRTQLALRARELGLLPRQPGRSAP